MWKVVYEAKSEKHAMAIWYVTKYPKGYVVASHARTSVGSSDLVYKRLENAIACAKHLAAY